jgi:exopolysaccharide biosynthesis polyprenyl glycosylphosphotransferase
MLSSPLSLISLSLLSGVLFFSFEKPSQVTLSYSRSDSLRWLVILVSVLLGAVVVTKFVHYNEPSVRIDRGVLITSAVLDIVLFIAIYVSLFSSAYVKFGRNCEERRILIIGSGGRARRLTETLIRWAGTPVYIVGYLDSDPARIGRSVLGYRILGTLSDITSVLKAHVIDEVMMAIPRTMIPQAEQIAQACEQEGVKFSVMTDLFEVRVRRTQLVEFGQIPILTHETVVQAAWKLMVKRTIDIVAVVGALPLVLPIMGILALAIKLDSSGPVFFLQERVGLKKRRFKMLKFRSMVQGADKLQAQVEHLNEAQGPIFKVANDPRITRVGRWLRRSSLDELPQIFHVLTGQMSLVGPRPMSMRDVNLFDEGIQRRRFSVKPGLTCLWQVLGRSQLPFTEWLRLDLQYIEHWSLRLDLKILWKTIPAVLKGKGAV